MHILFFGKISWSYESETERNELNMCSHAALMFLSCFVGDLWSGSEGGVIKVWYGEAIEKSLVLQREEKRKTSFLVERSSIDLRAMVSDGGACPLPAVDVKLLLSDNSRSKVWSAGYLSFSLWYRMCSFICYCSIWLTLVQLF